VGRSARFRLGKRAYRPFVSRRRTPIRFWGQAQWIDVKILDNTFLFNVMDDPLERANLKERRKDIYDRLIGEWNAWNATMLPPQRAQPTTSRAQRWPIGMKRVTSTLIPISVEALNNPS
jgi:hypothetical protein